MKTVKLLIFFSMLLLNATAMGGCNSDLPEEIYKHWIHSFEEDTKDIKVFRPEYYNFPRARGRDVFEIKENGEFIKFGTEPTDRIVKDYGRWKVEGREKITVSFEKEEFTSFTIHIISFSNDVLRIAIN